MALFYAVRRATSSVAPVALRELKQQRFIHSTVRSALQNHCRREIVKGTSWIPSRAATSVVAMSKLDENLLAALDETIQQDETVSEPAPTQNLKPDDAIPFEIEDLPGIKTFTLLNKYRDEEIRVVVLPGEDIGLHKDEDSEYPSVWGGYRVPLTVTVSKGEGTSLEFNCIGYFFEITIESVSLKPQQPTDSDARDGIRYNGPKFTDLDEKLQNELQKYLELRGVTAYLSNFMVKYMIYKEGNEYTNWLKKVKAFVEK